MCTLFALISIYAQLLCEKKEALLEKERQLTLTLTKRTTQKQRLQFCMQRESNKLSNKCTWILQLESSNGDVGRSSQDIGIKCGIASSTSGDDERSMSDIYYTCAVVFVVAGYLYTYFILIVLAHRRAHTHTRILRLLASHRSSDAKAFAH